VRYGINCIGDAIDPALHNMPMSLSEIKRKKNLSSSQAVSSYMALATISYTNLFYCSAAKVWKEFRRLENRSRWEIRALQTAAVLLRPANPPDNQPGPYHKERYDHSALPQGCGAKNLSFAVQQDASVAGARSSPEHFLGHRDGPPCLFMRLACADGSGRQFAHPGGRFAHPGGQLAHPDPSCPVRSAQASA
jgi:hypothetical protein